MDGRGEKTVFKKDAFQFQFLENLDLLQNEVILIPESEVTADKGPLPWVIEAKGWGEVASVSINY